MINIYFRFPSNVQDFHASKRVWVQHPIVIHELTRLFLAWNALMDLFNPSDPSDDLAQVLVLAPRDWLDLTNAGAPAVERVKKDTTLCARSGRHVG